MNYIVVDASLWVARLVPQEVFHQSVRAWMEARRLEETEFLAPAQLLAEVAGAISRRTGDAGLAAQAVEQMEHLPGLRLVEMDQAVIESAAQMAASLGMRGGDAIYAAVAHWLNLSLATLDSDQKERASKMIKVETLW